MQCSRAMRQAPMMLRAIRAASRASSRKGAIASIACARAMHTSAAAFAPNGATAKHVPDSTTSSNNTSSASSSSSSADSRPPFPASTRVVVVPPSARGSPRDAAVVRTRPVRQLGDNEMLVRVSAAAVNPIDVMMCGGYGRELVSLAQRLSDPLAPLVQCGSSSRSGSATTGAADESLDGISLGREGVGQVVSLGGSVWGPWTLGERVWFVPRIGSNEGTLSEYCIVDPRNEVGQAPANLSDPEAASLPFAITTAWTALVDCAGIRPAPLPKPARKFVHRAGVAEPQAGSDLGVLRNLGVEPSRVEQGLHALADLPLVGSLASRFLPVRLSPQAPRRALVHGASGSVGLVAIQLLQRAGFEVYATTQGATRGSLDELVKRQADAEKNDPDRKMPELHIIDTDQQKIEDVVTPRSLAVFLDGVGGDAVFNQALQLLASSGQMVTLRGEGVKTVDEAGLIQGTLQSGAAFAQKQSRAAEYNAAYHWAISTPNAHALDYVSALISAGLWHTNLQPVSLWRGGVSHAVHALQAAHDEASAPASHEGAAGAKPRHVVLFDALEDL